MYRYIPLLEPTTLANSRALKAGSSLLRHVTFSAYEAPLTCIVGFPSASQTQGWLDDLFEQVQLREATNAVA